MPVERQETRSVPADSFQTEAEALTTLALTLSPKKPGPTLDHRSFLCSLNRPHRQDPQCMVMDETLHGVSEKVKNFAMIWLVDITQVPDFTKVRTWGQSFWVRRSHCSSVPPGNE